MPTISQYFQTRQPSAVRLAQIEFAKRQDGVKAVNTAIGNVSLPMHPAMQQRLEQAAKAHQEFKNGVLKYTPSVGVEETQQAFLNIISSSGFKVGDSQTGESVLQAGQVEENVSQGGKGVSQAGGDKDDSDRSASKQPHGNSQSTKQSQSASQSASRPLQVLVTNGGSVAMELAILGVTGPAADQSNSYQSNLHSQTKKSSSTADSTSQPSTDLNYQQSSASRNDRFLLRPLLLIEPAYTNYQAFATRVDRPTIAITRQLQPDGQFTLPDFEEIEQTIQQKKPGAILIIPYDNPSGQFFNQETINRFAQLAVKYDLWLISDEAYRELHYTQDQVSSIWGATDETVPGIEGRRISIESASKVWNACGLRIGALVTDNQLFHDKALAEFTANLGAGAVNQYVFGGLANLSHQELQSWYQQQRSYYQELITKTAAALKQQLPGLIVSQPQASIYSVVDVRQLVAQQLGKEPDQLEADEFDAQDFVMYCAQQGKVEIGGEPMTLLAAPMAGFYSGASSTADSTVVEANQPEDKNEITQKRSNPGTTQMRIAYIETPDKMELVPVLFAKLWEQYWQQR